MPRGGSSHDRRRQRRAAGRNGAEGSTSALHSVPSAELDAEALFDRRDRIGGRGLLLTAAASGSTSLPLSDRDVAWDAAAARASLSDGQFADAHFWRDSTKPADQITSYKLGFAKNNPPLTAVWRGVTAAAAAIQGSRGGVDIPSGDVAGVKSRIGSYYSKAAKKYNDPSIKTPWTTTADDAVEILRARDWSSDEVGEEDAALVWAIAVANAECPRSEDDLDDREFAARMEQLYDQFEPSRERAALALVQVFADGEVTPSMPCANCDHTAMQHEGDDNMGACTIDSCDCDGFQPENEEGASATADGSVRLGIRFPDEVIERASAVLVSGAELVDLSERTTDVTQKMIERVTFRLENLRLEDGDLQAAAGEATIPDVPATTGLRWTADAAFEGVLTDDGRCFAPGSLSWRELPLTLGAMLDTPHAEVVTESKAAGAITSIERQGNTLVASGNFDAGPFGQEVARMVTDGTLRGISVDVAVAQSEVAPKLDFFDEEGRWRETRVETSQPEVDLIDILFGDPADMIYVVEQGTIGAITVCPFPAFADARIEIASSLVSAASPVVWTLTQQSRMAVTGIEPKEPEPEAMTASAVGLAPLKPPLSWFEDPEFDQLTALTVTDEGRVFGHAAPWGTCHIAIPDVCTEAPRTQTEYDYFHLKEILTEDGTPVHVGTITLGTGHAGRGLGVNDTTAHYDDTGTAAVDVVVGEDEFGIWVAGALRPEITEEQARQLQGAVLSGDWRYVEFSDGSGNLELVALLAVNVPGFPIPRTRALIAAGDEGMRVVALVAAGVHIGSREEEQLEKISVLGDIAKYKALAARARA